MAGQAQCRRPAKSIPSHPFGEESLIDPIMSIPSVYIIRHLMPCSVAEAELSICLAHCKQSLCARQIHRMDEGGHSFCTIGRQAASLHLHSGVPSFDSFSQLTVSQYGRACGSCVQRTSSCKIINQLDNAAVTYLRKYLLCCLQGESKLHAARFSDN